VVHLYHIISLLCSVNFFLLLQLDDVIHGRDVGEHIKVSVEENRKEEKVRIQHD
jgi:hypothetical protein